MKILACYYWISGTTGGQGPGDIPVEVPALTLDAIEPVRSAIVDHLDKIGHPGSTVTITNLVPLSAPLS